ncbi:gtp cyclohydrolase ii [Nannochloropsis gaditana CCMP526]|uniref:gtp cyclohydrolase ii n=1 Tax=Nannochloropsis gaditana (strain CCMP526) TaxID=1093141 RepID=UPI00029F52C9|nr:gtp cyclohydrolase ii [Nannochloropsis gaditana CCMP526]EKU21887.1 gtp cyclohydrolase ii [Nannochloropsis gaditana CCMP526]|eukprot:XP_005854470.1 gtp cyclohydrolase ii [Nannochloropsis gaditana CCMP526]
MHGISTLGKRRSSIDESTIPEPDLAKPECYTLTTHDQQFGSDPIPMKWGEEDPEVRGPIVATTRHQSQRNAIGAHSGSYCIYKALAVAAGALDPYYKPRFENTTPVAKIGPFPQWWAHHKIVAMDPFGHVTQAMKLGRLHADGNVLTKDGQVNVTKAAIEPVWYLPAVAERFSVSEAKLRETLFVETNMMYPELITRPDIKVTPSYELLEMLWHPSPTALSTLRSLLCRSYPFFPPSHRIFASIRLHSLRHSSTLPSLPLPLHQVFLPPIGGSTVYIFGDPEKIPDESVPLTARVHDECNGSDVFGSDICTCRPYLIHAIEECVRTAVEGGTGIIVYYRKEGRALGEVTKYLVYNMRKRQEGGDRADEYFNCTQHVAGITDTRFQYEAITKSGISIDERVPIPPGLVPKDASVEIAAKVFAGYDGGSAYTVPTKEDLSKVKGRAFIS